MLFQDEEVAHKILSSADPLTMKIQGRKVRGFDDDVWTTQCVEIVTRGVTAKVSLNTGTEKTEHHYRNRHKRGDSQGKIPTQVQRKPNIFVEINRGCRPRYKPNTGSKKIEHHCKNQERSYGQGKTQHRDS